MLCTKPVSEHVMLNLMAAENDDHPSIAKKRTVLLASRIIGLSSALCESGRSAALQAVFRRRRIQASTFAVIVQEVLQRMTNGSY